MTNRDKLYNSSSSLEEVVKASSSFCQILKYFNIKTSGPNYYLLKEVLVFFNIKYDHIKDHKVDFKRKPLKELLVYNKYSNSAYLKYRLIKEKLKEFKCEICNLTEWQNKKIPIHLHHIDGDRLNNLIDNLQILCVNCHSQTKNFCRNRLILTKIQENKLKLSEIDPNWRNRPRLGIRKAERPTKEELEKLLWEMPTTHIAKIFEVSDKAIEKWSKAYGLQKPPRGYWSSKKIKNSLL